ncbi:unnamed protein product [Rotaria socialis]|uniref:NAD(P)(+)--arginine ADP-ribosyltransferase n=3 Tax=Rotaria socialis TaxID=392032 RepID=A0A818HHS5_9BILA|nr:unnamed protein product [Rotaria socialis]
MDEDVRHRDSIISDDGDKDNMESQTSNQMTMKTIPGANGVSAPLTASEQIGMLQNFLLVWLHAHIDDSNTDFTTSLTKVRSTVSTLIEFTEVDQCVDYLESNRDQTILLIVSETFVEDIMPLIHDMSQLDTVVIFHREETQQKELANKWSKVQGSFTSIESVCESLKIATEQCEHDAMPISFVSKDIVIEASTNNKSLDRLEPSYMYSVLFKEIILEIEEDDIQAMKDLVVYCRQKDIDENQLNKFECDYHCRSPIWWYTCENFLYRMLNRALGSLDMEIMTKLGFFIRSLHRQLEQLHQEQSSDYLKPFQVYRGQGFSKENFENICNTKGGLLSFNNFLSTSREPKIAEEFLKRAVNKNEQRIGVLFIITINLSKVSGATTPFALIEKYSSIPREREILFSMHTVFRVDKIKETVGNSRIWEVHLTLTDTNDPELAALTCRIREELCGSTPLQRLGHLMIKVGDFNQAGQFYNELLEKASNDSDRAHIYHQIGSVRKHQGQYKEASLFFNNSLKIQQKTLSEDHITFVSSYNELGMLYNDMGDYLKALQFHGKCVEITKKISLSNDVDLATSYNNIGSVYYNMGDYMKALEFYEKSKEIKEETLPLNHPDLAVSYNNIGSVYDGLGDYLKALVFYKKSLEGMKNGLPTNHIDLAISYNNIGSVYYNMGDCTKALEFYKQAHQIKENALPVNHPDLATSYNNIGSVYEDLDDYPKALEFYKKSNEIFKIVLPSNHPYLATSYNNIGSIYHEMGDYTTALKLCQNAFHIQRKTFQEDNLAFVSTYSLLGRVHRSMNDYSRALKYFEKCLAILQQTLPHKHPSWAIVYTNLGDVHRLIGNYEIAVSFNRKALNI